jgi:hypothetical protein
MSRVTIYLPPECDMLLQALESENGANKSQVIQRALNEYADNHGYVLIPARVDKVEKAKR